MNILVVGASGYIGEYIFNKYAASGDNVKALSRRELSGAAENDVKIFDMKNIDNIKPVLSEFFQVEKNKKIKSTKHAIICAAQTSIDRCKNDKKAAYDINVIFTKKLLLCLKECGYHVIFCSSDNVFDGKSGNYSEKDSANPVNEYGKMKLEIERHIQEKYPEFCIVRLPKVIGRAGHKKDMLQEWENMAAAGKEIFCIRDNFFSPVHIEDVSKCFKIIMEREISGIYHVCGDKRYSRIELCKKFLAKIGLNAIITEKNLEDFNFADNRPLDTSMLNNKFCGETGYKFADLIFNF